MNANIFFEVWNNLVSVINIVLDVMLTMTDAHSGNIVFQLKLVLITGRGGVMGLYSAALWQKNCKICGLRLANL